HLACWGAQAASLLVLAACRGRETASPQNSASNDVAGRAAGNYRLAACAPQNSVSQTRCCETRALPKRRCSLISLNCNSQLLRRGLEDRQCLTRIFGRCAT